MIRSGWNSMVIRLVSSERGPPFTPWVRIVYPADRAPIIEHAART